MIIRTEDFSDVSQLKPHSTKKIWYKCRICGCGYLIKFGNYNKKVIPDLCFNCRYEDEEFKRLMSNKVSKSKIGIKKTFNTKKSPYYNKLKELTYLEGYEMITTLDEYIKGDAWLTLKCPNGHPFITTFKLWTKQGNRCILCKEQERINRILKICNEKGHIFNRIEDSYVVYTCSKGHSCRSTLPNFYKGVDCLTCSISEKVSKPEKEIVKYIQSLGIKNIITSDRSVIYPYELDIYLPDHNLAIEYNGKWFHDETYKDKHYHLMKTNLCNNENIQLIHIFDDEWEFKKDIVKNRLKHILGLNDKHIYARKCIVKEINTKEAKKFCEQYHIQGYGVSSVRLGLYYNNELVSVMTFSKPSVSKGNNKKQGTWELNRYCSSFISVVGGASKLLSYFQKFYNWEFIYSYADRRWSQGSLYYKLGFELDYITEPNYWYWNKKERDITRYHRFKFRKDKIKHLGEGTEKQIMDNLGWGRIWDCGHYKFIMKKGE